MTAYALIAAGLAVMGGGLIWLAVINHRADKDTGTAWIDKRIAAETDPARRTSWRMLRRAEQED